MAEKPKKKEVLGKGKVKWKKPNGTIIITNDRKETIKAAVELGWKNV